MILLQGANEPEDIAAMITFLASPGRATSAATPFNGDGGPIPD
jgi:hypothetical protein